LAVATSHTLSVLSSPDRRPLTQGGPCIYDAHPLPWAADLYMREPMQEFSYIVLWFGLVCFGLMALVNYPEYEGAGVVLGLYVLVASTAAVAFVRYTRSIK